jgi:membrane-bound acyltransferase YfiQ involved in biofilm formation
MSFFTETAKNILGGFDVFYRIIGPPLLAAIFLFGGLGYFILDMYKFNVTKNIEGSFPSQFIINFYFGFMVIAIVFIMLILVFQTIIIRKQGTGHGLGTSTPTTPPNP